MELNLRYEIRVVDEDTDEEIYKNSAFSMESLEEQDHRMRHSIAKWVADKERHDEDELTPEELQLKSDEAREQIPN